VFNIYAQFVQESNIVKAS